MEKIKKILKKNINNLPNTAGVYLFFARQSLGEGGLQKPIYIGKAINIKNRVKSHFYQPSYRDNLFIDKVNKISFIKTDSEIEALILEANLIKKHQPKFNVVWRDDKNYFYVAVAENKIGLPYVYITHQPTKKLEIRNLKLEISFVGPFVDGNSLKKTLKYLRKAFPYYTSASHPKQKCTWCHLELCPGVNPDIDKYKRDIRKLILVLQGKRKNALSQLKKEMKAFSYSREYENAAKVRNQISALERVMAHTNIISNQPLITNNWNSTKTILQNILGMKNSINRIECYDISNIQGKHATGSMIVFKDGQPDKNEYKKFKIRMKQEPNDIAMLKEVLQRRFSHQEWLLPEVILIDGGKAQLNIAVEVRIKKLPARSGGGAGIPKVISIAKGRQELFIEGKNKPISLKDLPREIYNLIKNLDDEAHRFAITYHKELRKKSILAI